MRALIEIYNSEAPTLIIHPDGHLECRYRAQAEINKIHEECSRAVKSAIYLIEHGFDYNSSKLGLDKPSQV